MPTNEFALINNYFSNLGCHRDDVILGIGDDCAVLQPTNNQQLVTTLDALVENIHFLPQMPPHALGYKALAISLSDIAAMGANPAWVMLGLTLPHADESWIAAFCEGLNQLLIRYSLALVGGNTSKGSLSVTTQVTGYLLQNKALRRDGAKPGDLIYVTGTLGNAALALQCLLKKIDLPSSQQQEILNSFYYPQPRINAGLIIHEYATAAIDISDGIAADLKHILKASKVGATIQLAQLPISNILTDNLPMEAAWQLALTGGEDYELCFTVSPQHQQAIENLFLGQSYPITCIGTIDMGNTLRLLTPDKRSFTLKQQGYEHTWSEK